MNLDSKQTNKTSPDGFRGGRSGLARRRSIFKEKDAGKAFLIFYGMAALFFLISLPLWFFTNSPDSSITLCACIAVVSMWYVAYNAKIYGGLTFSSCFVAVSAFVFVARGIYISIYNDFDILTSLGQPAEHRLITEALVYVLYGTLAFIFGALLLESKTVAVTNKSHVHKRIATSLLVPNLSFVFIGIQVAFVFLLLPYGLRQNRSSLVDDTPDAYIYLLPTLIHGFNLYAFAYMASIWVRKKNAIHSIMLFIFVILLFLQAYFLYNMSNFRSFYLIGIFTAGLVFILARFGKVPVLVLLLIFALYPMFKNMGSDRTLSNKEMLENVLLSPADSYNADGMERAFGSATDINMLDTLVASLHYEHKFHPYVLTDLYVFVHWIPRSVWPSKPAYGVLSDLSYTLGLPYSPGIIGFFNDDGGKIYMIVAMGFLGVFFKWCEILTLRIRWQELYLCVWAALFFTALLTVRCLPYQVFYGFLVFFLPALLLNRLVKLITGHGASSIRSRKTRIKINNRPVVS